jgi:thiamine-monophosphate kinase
VNRSPSEFDLIARYFTGHDRGDGVLLGVGDDAALLAPLAPGEALAVTVDTLVAGVHFDPAGDPAALGHKLLAVNLSDLAAMGAEPLWATLALTLPTADPTWLEAFSGGLAALAAEHGVALVGGDTTRGPLTLTLQAAGRVPADRVLRRAGARPGDGIYVTGTLGDAALALRDPPDLDRGERAALRQRLERPTPRVAAGRALRGLASAAIDISDGLAADLGHVLDASGVGATVTLADLPLTPALARLAAAGDWQLPLAGGDDYELCFTVPAAQEEAVAAAALAVAATRIGTVEAAPGLRLLAPDGTPYRLARAGYDHFGDAP